MRQLLGFGAGLALLVSSATPALAEAGYDGGFFLAGESGDASYKLKLSGRLQTRLSLELFEEAGRDAELSFALQRGRVGLEGHVLSKDLTYKFQAEFGGGKVALKDYYWNYALSDGLQVRAGQWKKPFSRQQITSSGKLELVDRAPTDKAFGAGRDLGLAFHNDYEGSGGGLEWVVGVFNGAGENAVPDVWEPEGVVRLGFSSDGFGKGRYSEGDLECAAKPEQCGLRWAVAASVYADGSMPADGKQGQVVSELDFFLKASGLSFSGALFADYNLGADADGGGLDKLGFYAQAGYYIASAKLLPALRFASIMPEDAAVATTREATVGLSYLPHRHDFKWQTDATMVMSELDGESATDWVIRTQAQLVF